MSLIVDPKLYKIWNDKLKNDEKMKREKLLNYKLSLRLTQRDQEYTEYYRLLRLYRHNQHSNNLEKLLCLYISNGLTLRQITKRLILLNYQSKLIQRHNYKYLIRRGRPVIPSLFAVHQLVKGMLERAKYYTGRIR